MHGETMVVERVPATKRACDRLAAASKLKATRRANLKRLVKDRFKGESKLCARDLAVTNSYVWQLLSGGRAMGERSARYIEETLGLGHGTLDKPIGEAFERTTILTAQLGNGETAQVRMVPVITAQESLLGTLARRKVMAKARRFLPAPMICSEHTYYIEVDFDEMTPRVKKGDHASVDPDRTRLEKGGTYWLALKGRRRHAIMRVAVQRDTGAWMFVCPPEGRIHGEARRLATAPVATGHVRVLGRVMGTYHALI